MPTDIEISRNVRLKHIREIGAQLGVPEDDLVLYGKHKAKLPHSLIDLEKIIGLGLDKLPVCIAKTQKSLSDNPALIGRPKDFVVTVREIEIAAGAGFLIPITGDIMRMPGLPEHPSSENIDIDENGNITGLF